jgi:adenine-specific DNA methylase
MTETWQDDLRLIEAGFPCHQVGAETQRERGASSALPPLYFLHVWWARRPLTPSRAAVLASLLPASTDPEWFLRQLGIEKKIVRIHGQSWTLVDKVLEKIQKGDDGREVLPVNDTVLKLLAKEQERRANNRDIIAKLKLSPTLSNDPVLLRWEDESQPIGEPWPKVGAELPVEAVAADPAHVNERIAFAQSGAVVSILGKPIKWNPEDLYGYNRAFANSPQPVTDPRIILDPTAGGGSIPFEAMRLGHTVIANELNPVAAVILHATLDYPAKYGPRLAEDIQFWGEKLLDHVSSKMADVTPFSALPEPEKAHLRAHCKMCPEVIPLFDVPEYDQTGILYCRQVTCPNCGGQAPLLNTCWLSKVAGDQWGVRIVPDGQPRNGTVRFETYRAVKGRGPKGEDPDTATVNRGTGTCVHCRQAIDAEEIKRQARGESDLGKWQDRLYCVVAVRFQPKLDAKGNPVRYKSGDRAGEIKTEKVRFFRPPNARDLAALDLAEKRLQENWDRWDREGLIPTENFPQGNDMRPVIYGMPRWCDMFTPRQLLGHLTLVEELNRLKPQILSELGEEKGRAVVTYLQFAIDKGVDYNSRQTRWEYTRGIVKGNFGRHDFSLKWTFGEMVFSGPNSGAAWALSQIVDSYTGMAELNSHFKRNPKKIDQRIKIINGTAAYMPEIADESVDLICMDPPYYNNVQYAELSDYFYVWQKRALGDFYPNYFKRRLSDKSNEAVANPVRDGGAKAANENYEKMMSEIFSECRRVLSSKGILSLMFTHKTQEAWETLTKSLINSGWIITASAPVESESTHSMHLMQKAGAVSSVFISCRKKENKISEPSLWTGIGGTGVAQQIRIAVQEGLKKFEALKLNPVDEMVASYGRALRVLSQNWPVIDGDEPVGPIRAMNEASRVVAENQISRITKGRIKVADLTPEAAMALTLFGIFGLSEFSFDEALNLSKSLNIRLETKPGGYVAEGRFIGINTQAGGAARRSVSTDAEEKGFSAPLVRKGSTLRLARPGERNPKRIEQPQTEWDLLHGLIMAHRQGDVPVARAYLITHAAGNEAFFKDLLQVWAAEVTDEKLRKEAQALLFGLR